MNSKNLETKIKALELFLIHFNNIHHIIVISLIFYNTYSRMSGQPSPNEAYQAYNNMFVNPHGKTSDNPPVANIFMISELPDGLSIDSSLWQEHQDCSSDLDACSNMAASQMLPAKKLQEANQLRLKQYRKIINKP
jgi:hypothetical protein